MKEETTLVAAESAILNVYPPAGARHFWTLAVAGTLKRLAVSQKDTEKIIQRAAEVAGDFKISDRLKDVDTTFSRGEGDATSGFKALEDLGDGALVKKLKSIFGIPKARGGFQLNTRGNIDGNDPENITAALNKMSIELSYDIFLNEKFLTEGNSTRQIDDNVANTLWFKIEEKYNFQPSYEMYRRALDVFSQRKPFHPVRDYLEALEWDGKPRLENWLITYGGADDSRYVKNVGSLTLRAAVKRVYQPGAKFDELLVLESDQGWDKSTALATLCPKPDWFTEDLPIGVDSKVVIERTKGIWIAEIAELFGMTKRQIDQVKGFLSRQKDGPVRLAYGRDSTHVPRQFICIATTNKKVYLKDPTGNRRFWPVKVGRFDIDALKKDRDQLWAEAYSRRNESIRMDEELWDVAKRQVATREASDPWERELVEIFADPPDHFLKKNKSHKYIRPGMDGFGIRASEGQIYEALAIPIDRQDDRSQDRIYSIMARLGFSRMVIRRDGKSIRGWGKYE